MSGVYDFNPDSVACWALVEPQYVAVPTIPLAKRLVGWLVARRLNTVVRVGISDLVPEEQMYVMPDKWRPHWGGQPW